MFHNFRQLAHTNELITSDTEHAGTILLHKAVVHATNSAEELA